METLAVLALTAVMGAAARAADPSAATALARRLEQHQKSVADLTARFVQTYRSGSLGREVVESGTLSIKRPGRMLWEYRRPEKKTFVADGKRYYFYVPADRQVIVRDQAGDRGMAALLLSGQADLLADFQVGLEAAPAGLQRLRLVPRKPDAEMESVLVDLDAGDRIRSIQVMDTQGNRSRFEFDQIRENVGLKDGLFRFKVPAGVEVVTG